MSEAEAVSSSSDEDDAIVLLELSTQSPTVNQKPSSTLVKRRSDTLRLLLILVHDAT